MSALEHQINEITECSICSDVFRDPRILPCAHTFCLSCLELYGRNKQSCSQLVCPLCRQKFVVPKGGMIELPKNHLVQKLVDVNWKMPLVPHVEESSRDSVFQILNKQTANFLQRKEKLEMEKVQLSKEVVDVVQEIRQQRDYLKSLIDDQAGELLAKLRHIQEEEHSRLRTYSLEVDATLSKLDDLRAQLSMSEHSDKELRTMRAELHVIARSCEQKGDLFTISFQPTDFPADRKNSMIGRIQRKSQKHALTESDVRVQLINTSSSTDSADGVVGLCVIDDLVHVVRSWSSKVEVFNSNLSALRRQIMVSSLDLPYYMTGCTRYKCLYLTDYGSDIHRVEVDGLHSKWPVGQGNLTLSVVNSTANVLVIYQAAQKVKEYTTHGSVIREIVLSPELVNPHHAVLLSTGEILLCHGFESDPLNRVCLLDTVTGEIIKCLQSIKSRDTVNDKLVQPSHIAVDETRSIAFIADSKNDRIVAINILTFGCVSVIMNVGRRPCAMFIDEFRKMLYAGSWETGQITVFSLSDS